MKIETPLTASYDATLPHGKDCDTSLCAQLVGYYLIHFYKECIKTLGVVALKM